MCNRRGRGRKFNFDLEMERLKGRLRKSRWAGIRVCKFVGCFDIGVVELGDGVIYVVLELVSDSMMGEVLR